MAKKKALPPPTLEEQRSRLAYTWRLLDSARIQKEQAEGAIRKLTQEYNTLLEEYTKSYPGLWDAWKRYDAGEREASGFSDLQDQAFRELREAYPPKIDRIGTQR